MIRALAALVFAICASACIVLPARANTCTVPNSLVNGQVVDANALNTNFVALQSCGNNIDSTNVGPAGILASQIISNSAAAGTFGGTAQYTFKSGIILNVSPSAIGLGNSLSGAYPTLTNSGEGGLNSQVLASSTFGQRWFKYDGTTLTTLAQLDNSGNFTPIGNVAAGGSGLFYSTTPASTVGIGTAFSSTYPTLTNSSEGGVNNVVAASSSLGQRWFKYDGTTLTLLGQLNNSGLLTAIGGATFNTSTGAIGIGQGIFSSTVPQINADGAGGMFLSVNTAAPLGYRFYAYNGTATQLFQITPAGNTATTGYATAATSGNTTQSSLGPMYSFTGAAVPNSSKRTITDVSCTTNSSGNCTVNASITGGSIYAASGTYSCHGDFISAATLPGYIQVTNVSASTVSVNYVGTTASTSVNAAVGCDGY